jgi:hypothetical protein
MENTLSWGRYQQGLDYKSKITLLPTTDKNERFYSGRQWEGVKSNGLPTPVLNVTKRIIDYKIAAVMSDNLTMQFSADGVGDNDPDGRVYREAAQILTQYSKTLWENLKLDSMNESGLLDAAISGDIVSYWYWNDKANDICGELIDNANFFPGDPNTSEINDAYGPVQPRIILAFRRNVSDVKQEAQENNVSEQDLQKITGDTEYENQPGDRSKIELEGEDGKCVVLLDMWREMVDGQWRIMAEKSTRSVVIRPKWDTGLTRYPVALGNWYKRKGSAHGEAEATSLISNQIMINQQAAMIALWIKLHGFPKVLYDKTRIGSWTNDLSLAIPVNGTDPGGVGGAAQYMQPAQISTAVMEFMTWFIQITKDMAGANDAALGEASATNTSAIIVLQKATAIPLNSIKRRFYQYVEDIGLIWLDFFNSKYSTYRERNLEITVDGVKQIIKFDTSILQQMKLKLKIDVGPSTQWNEAAAAQTLDNLLGKQMITFIEYLKRLPNGLIPDRQGLIDDRESAERQKEKEDKEFMYELMAREMEQIESTLPPESLNELKMLQRNDPANYEKQAKELIRQKPVSQPAPTQKQPTQKGPSTAIAFKDLPPEGKVQLAAQAGIQITTEQAANMTSMGGDVSGLSAMQQPFNG